MRISCPNCSAAYEVPDSALATGPRLLRCARCGHQFQAALPGTPAASPSLPPTPLAAPPAAASPPFIDPAPPEATPPPAAPAEPGKRGRGPLPAPEARSESRLGDSPASKGDRFALAGWLLTFAMLGVAGYAFVSWRTEIVAAWPPVQRLYSLIGLG